MSQKFSSHGYEFIGIQDHGKVDGSCFNCGLGIRYFAIFKNQESGELIHIGKDCLANSTPEQKKQFSEAERIARIARKREKFISEFPITKELIRYCEENPFVRGESEDGHIHEINRSLKYSGCINDGQIRIVTEFLTPVV